jgi:drug/metabolite transporter (DMT)-like permease
MKPSAWQVGVILFIGVGAVSTAAILIRLAMEAAGMQSVGFSLFLAASRLILAAVILLPTWRNFSPTQVTKKSCYYAIAAGICLALHFATWISSLAFTSIAASTTLVTTNPIWVALLSRLWWGERLTKLTIFGMAIALGGGILIAWDGFETNDLGANPILGDMLALVGAWMASLYILFGTQAQKQGLSIGNYIAIAYTTAALILLPLPPLFGVSYFGHGDRVYVYVLLMAILAQIIGHTSFNWALRWISPTFVTLNILFEPIGSSFLGMLVFAEVPSILVILGGLLLLIGVATAVVGKQKVDFLQKSGNRQ